MHFYQWNGTCSWTDWNLESESTINDDVQSSKMEIHWSGMEAFGFEDGEVGLLLDLDAGTLTVYKNGRRLGVMKDVSTVLDLDATLCVPYHLRRLFLLFF